MINEDTINKLGIGTKILSEGDDDRRFLVKETRCYVRNGRLLSYDEVNFIEKGKLEDEISMADEVGLPCGNQVFTFLTCRKQVDKEKNSVQEDMYAELGICRKVG